MKWRSFNVGLVLSSALAALVACGSSDSGAPTAPSSGPVDPATGTAAPLPVETAPPSVYVAKVKNILVGLPPTDAEVQAVIADPNALAGLIDGWMQLPQYQTKMLRFFQLAFQQTQIDEIDFDDQTFPTKADINRPSSPLLVQNLTESFARTVFALVSQGHPLTEAMTTRQLMVTTAVANFYTFLDAWQVDDQNTLTDRFMGQYPKAKSISATERVIPFASSINPADPDYMTFTFPGLTDLKNSDDQTLAQCWADPVTDTGGRLALTLERILQGSINGHKNPAGGKACPPAGGAAFGALAAADFADWHMVTTRQPTGKETATDFFDLPKLRAASELVLSIPRVGFFSTPAFFANWQTNTSNQMRVTMNQALIVGIGAAVDGTDVTQPPTTVGLDTTHAGAPACFTCHQTLDPTRAIFAQNWSWTYHNQTENAFAKPPAGQVFSFQFQGVMKPVATLDDFGNTLATHPLFAKAWAQKLCYYANSRKCDDSDPELARIIDVFETSNYAWNTLVRELLASPITTNAKITQTLSDEGEVLAVSRRDHWCAALNARLGFEDICGLRADLVEQGGKTVANVRQIVSGLPSDGYGRGSIAPVLPNDPTLFSRAGTENICVSVADLVIDPTTKGKLPNAKAWLSTNSDAAIGEFVSLVMAIPPSDARSAAVTAALKQHYTSAMGTGATATDSLKSTFVVACTAPSAVSMGL